MGYQGPAEDGMMENFIRSNPAISSKMGQFSKALKRGFAEGGAVFEKPKEETTPVTTPVAPTPIAPVTDPEKATSDFITKGTDLNTQITALQNQLDSETDKNKKKALEDKILGLSTEYNKLSAANQSAQAIQLAESTAAQKQLTSAALTDPSSLVKTAEVEKVTPAPGTEVTQDTGKVGDTPTIEATKIEETEKAVVPEETETNTIDVTKVSDEVTKELEELQAAKGQVSAEGTVKGQLEILMEDFEKDGTPPWASGAMRAAMSSMQARGLGASSIAGQAITQAAMESAIAIAQQDAATVAQFEMQNLNNEQQTLIFKSQQKIAGLFTDQAADNAAKQFNASSKNQTDQFFASLKENVSRFNASQVNAVRQFNAGAENTTKQFNSQMQDLRDRFNATNSLVIAQANAQWRQNIATTNTAAQNQANMDAAKTTNGLTAAQLDNIWQRERDLMAFAFTSSESALDRNTQLLLADKNVAAEKDIAKTQAKSADNAALGKIAATVLFGGGLF